MNGFGDFLVMGGYALYIWPAYGLTALVLGGLWLSGARRAKRAAQDLAALEPSTPREGRRS